MAQGLIVITIVLAAVIVLIAVLLKLRSGRSRTRLPEARPPAWPTPDDAPADAPAVATPLATQVRRSGESELTFRLRASRADPPDFLPQSSPRPSAPPPSSAMPPPQRGLISISTVGDAPRAGAGSLPAAAPREPTRTMRPAAVPRPTHRRLVLASGMILVAVLGTSVALINWSTGGVLTATGTPGAIAIGSLESPTGGASGTPRTHGPSGAGATPGPDGGGGGTTGGGGGATGGGGGAGPGGQTPGATPRAPNPTPHSTPTEPPTPNPTPRPTPRPTPTPAPTPAGKALEVDFDVTVDGLSADFRNHTRGAASWQWHFGDGDTSTARNPTHDYSHAGTYHVVLTAVSESGDTATVTKTVTVAP